MPTQELDFPYTITTDSDSYIVIARPPTFTSDEFTSDEVMEGFESIAHAADDAMWDVLAEDWLEDES